jgi:predicted heme/steroid binding protein
VKNLTPEELARYDGLEGRPAYIAYRGKVYDVSDSFLWMGGRHQVLHDAGRDLTAALDEAPHGADLLDRVPVVGTVSDGDA